MPRVRRLMTKLSIVSMFKKRIALARRKRNHSERLAAGLDRIHELYGSYTEWRRCWIEWRDETARKNAVAALAGIHAQIRRLSRNGNRPELIAFLRRTKIPGWRKAFVRVPTRRR